MEAKKNSLINKIETAVKIDGVVIKQIREQQSLTQLYVAKMVGVTTDTISRWENNRYPTIKKVNAERLAQALEVSLDAILGSEVEEPSPDKKNGRKYWLLGLGAVLCLVVLWIFIWHGTPDIKAQRILPSYASPGVVIPVKLSFSGVGVRGVVRETVPSGWQVIGAVPKPSSIDNDKGLIRWLVQLGEQPVQIYYLLRVSDAAELHTMVHFSGEVVAHDGGGSDRIELLGADQLVVAHIHWADLNGDGVIDDDEMLEVSYLSENMPNLALDIDAIEALWIEDSYHWDEQQGCFLPGQAGDTVISPIK